MVIGVRVDVVGDEVKHLLNLEDVSSASVGTTNSEGFDVLLDGMLDDGDSFEGSESGILFSEEKESQSQSDVSGVRRVEI
jgi:hypothetical protein